MLSLKKNAHKPLLIYLILNNIACSGFPKRPDGFVYHLNTVDGVAYEMAAPKTPHDNFKPTNRELKLDELDTYFCVSPSYQLDLNFWVQDVIKAAKEKCK